VAFVETKNIRQDFRRGGKEKILRGSRLVFSDTGKEVALNKWI
jgi:hypothetical protein